MASCKPELTAVQAEVCDEVAGLHRFISAWFRGEVPATDDNFDLGFARRLAPSMINIQPAGKVLTHADLVDSVRSGYATNPGFTIEIQQVKVLGVEGGLAFATYFELQRGAKNTVPSDNARISTVLLQRDESPRPFRWLHIHETATVFP